MDRLVAQLETSDRAPPADIHIGGALGISTRSNFEPAAFERAVEKCVEYIRAGDIFRLCSASVCTWSFAASRSRFTARCES